MRKVKLVFIVLLVALTVSGCSSGSIPFKRERNASDDEIKFYGFEWLTEAEAILDKFDKDFGKDSYELKKWQVYVTDSEQGYTYSIEGKNDSKLLWNIAGHELECIEFDCISIDGGKNCYLRQGTFYFDYDVNVYNDLKDKLSKLYTFNEKDENSYMFIDKNENRVRVALIGSYCMIDYCCGDSFKIETMNSNEPATDNKINKEDDTTGL